MARHMMSSQLTEMPVRASERPGAWIRWSGMSLRAATVAAPMRKLWLEKLPSICAVEKICHSQSVKIERDRGWPFARRNKGPVTFPRTERYASNAWTAQRGALPKPIWMWQPWRNGSVFDAFILTRRQVDDWSESTAMSATERWIAGEKLAKLGTVNSVAWRKPK